MTRTRAVVISVFAGTVLATLATGVAFADDRGFGGGFGRHRRGDGVFILFPLLLLLAVAALVAVLWKGRQPGAFSPPPPAGPPASPTLNAQAILADRLARGEISPDDYRAAIAVLREPPPVP